MKNQRRTFLQTASILTTGSLILPQWACTNAPTEGTATKESSKVPMKKPKTIDKFGIQLYTLRDEMPKDPKGVLKQLASFGYSQIESYEGKDGMFWGMSNTEFKSYLGDLGMEVVSSHVDIYKDFETKVEQAAEIGMKYMVCPWVGPQKNKDDWKKITDTFNKCGALCKKNGIGFAYHNHDYSFKAFSGMIPHDYMMDHTDPELVDFEMDIYWVVTGGADPVEYLKKYENRFRLCHVKDRSKTATPEEREMTCNLGTGSIDFANILKVAQETGMQYYLVEQERYPNSTPLESAKVGAAYLKQLVLS